MKVPIRGVPPLVKVLDLQVFAQEGLAEHVLYHESPFETFVSHLAQCFTLRRVTILTACEINTLSNLFNIACTQTERWFILTIVKWTRNMYIFLATLLVVVN